MRDEGSLQDLISNFNTFAGSLAREDDALAASLPLLRDTLRVAQPALQSIDNALPSLRAFARDALPGVRSSDDALAASRPFIAQLRALFTPAELRGTAAVLRAQIPNLADFNRVSLPLLDESRQLSACTNNVLVPFVESRIPDPDFPANTNHRVVEQMQHSFPNLAGESRLNDGNNQTFHAGPVAPGPNVRPAPPTDGGFTPPPHRPDQPCEIQELPNLERARRAGDLLPIGRDLSEQRHGDTGTADLDGRLPPGRPRCEGAARGRAGPPEARPAEEAEGGERMTRAIRAHLGDFIAILLLVVVGLATTGYILSNERFRFPYIEEEPFNLEVELSDAQAVTAGQGQTVRVAGVRIGDIGTVELEDGKAVVGLELDPEYEGLIRQDATALLRSKTGLKDMFLEVDPGTGEPLDEGDRIPMENTAPDIDPDEFLSALDTDTRDYLKLLITGAGKGLEGHGDDLRAVFARFEPLHRDLARVTTAIARRRDNLKRLVNRYGLLVEELGGKDRELTRLVQQANAVFSAFASEDQNVSAFVSKLPGTLGETKTALAKVDTLGDQLGPTLESLRPAFRELDDANAAVIPLAEKGTPIVRDEIRPFARIAQPYTRDFGTAAGRLAEAGPDLSGAFHHLNRFFNMGAYNPEGTEELTGDPAVDRDRQEGYLYWLAWIGQNTVSVFNVHDATGPIRRVSARRPELPGVRVGVQGRRCAAGSC